MFIGNIPPREFEEQFFTFLVNQNGVISSWRWQPDIKLRNNLAQEKRQNSEFRLMCENENDIYLVKYFLDICQNDSTVKEQKTLAKNHIIAYLQSPAFQAFSQLKYIDFNHPEETQELYLDIAKSLISDLSYITKIYRKYDPNQSKLFNYFVLILFNTIREQYHRETGQGRYSTWGTLHKTSEKKLTENLKKIGFNESKINQCLMARFCLFQVYSRTGKCWQEPTDKDYQNAVNYCSQHHFSISTEQFKILIQDCLDAVLFSPKIDYVGADIDTWLLNTNSSDDISSTTVYSSERLSNKMLVYIEHINQLLTEELLKQELLLEKSSKCPQDHKNQNQVILILSFGFGFSGKSIGKKLGINQSTVSRRCQKIEEKLLMVIASWMQEISNINLSEIKNLDTYIKQWIIAYYKEKIDLVIQEKFDSNLSNQTKDVIRAYYFQIEQNNQTIKQKKQAITQRLNITRKELNEQLETAKNQLLNDLCNWLENELSIEIHETEDIEKVKKVLETWLTNSHLTY